MAANIDPIYTRKPNIYVGAAALTTAATGLDGTSSTVVFTADATNGSYLQHLRFKPASHNAGTTNTVARIFVNDGSTGYTFYDDFYLPATTAAAAASTPAYTWVANLALPAGYKIYVSLGTTSTNGWKVTAVGGDY